MSSDKTYSGIHNDRFGGMTPTGTLIRDAWVFGLVDESQTCEGWNSKQLQALHEQVSRAWEPYGFLVSNLPPELRERHGRIHGEAFERARELGWQADDLSDEI